MKRAEPWECAKCGAPGVKNLGTEGYCTTHLSVLYRSFDPAVFRLSGRWVEAGRVRLDHGPGYVECECPGCGATAVAVVGSPCGYCAGVLARMIGWQAEKALTPPRPEPDDTGYVGVMLGWAERLAVAVVAGIVDEDEARRVWNRETGRSAAA